mgnify:CR=1 FL=1
MKRRQWIQQGGLAGILAAGAAPAVAQGLPDVRWRLTSSFPKTLDTLYGAAENVAKQYGITEVASSSSIRCVETVRPFAERMGYAIDAIDSVSEEAFALRPKRGVREVLVEGFGEGWQLQGRLLS